MSDAWIPLDEILNILKMDLKTTTAYSIQHGDLNSVHANTE